MTGLKLAAWNMQAAIDLTEAQQLDLMHLRRLFYGRIGQLLRERKTLLARVDTDTKELWAQQSPPGSADIAKQLRANGLAEYRTYMQFASTFFRGVRQLCSCNTVLVILYIPSLQAWVLEIKPEGQCAISTPHKGFAK